MCTVFLQLNLSYVCWYFLRKFRMVCIWKLDFIVTVVFLAYDGGTKPGTVAEYVLHQKQIWGKNCVLEDQPTWHLEIVAHF